MRVLLFRLAQWHALAKLRLHTDQSLVFLDEATRLLSSQLRKFRDFTCTAFHTTELPSETAARWRRKEGKSNTSNSTASAACPKSFNLTTYKLHALGDYVRTIRLFRTTDSDTTQIVRDFIFVIDTITILRCQGEVSHQFVKKFYQCTNKHEPAKQIAKQERRRTRIRHQHDIYYTHSDDNGDSGNDSISLQPQLHHQLSNSPSNTFNLAEFLRSSPNNPAFQVSSTYFDELINLI